MKLKEILKKLDKNNNFQKLYEYNLIGSILNVHTDLITELDDEILLELYESIIEHINKKRMELQEKED